VAGEIQNPEKSSRGKELEERKMMGLLVLTLDSVDRVGTTVNVG
jgi:hypothetical protein